MFKTISAALLAASMIAAPAFAAGTGKTAQTPAAKTEQAPAINGAQAKTDIKTGSKSDIKANAKVGTKARALNANAKMHRHHYKSHKTGALKSKKHLATVGKIHTSKTHANKTHSKVSFKRTAPATKRG